MSPMSLCVCKDDLMKLPLSVANHLLKLSDGQPLPFSSVKHSVVEDLIAEGVLDKKVLSPKKAVVRLPRIDALNDYLQNHYGIENLTQYVDFLNNEIASRADAVSVSSDSKTKSIRTFKGFLVNCYEPIESVLNKQLFVIQPNIGTFTFIYDFNNFIPAQDVTIIGIENAENFRFIEQQKYLFEGIKPLFVSRYPQNQSNDLINWLKMIPNNYLHFGDFDFGGLNIYWNEFKVHLGERAKFYLPTNLEILLKNKGNRDLYDYQSIKFDEAHIHETNVLKLLMLIRRYKKGLEQEILIQTQ
jgi:hypothetical protein